MKVLNKYLLFCIICLCITACEVELTAALEDGILRIVGAEYISTNTVKVECRMGRYADIPDSSELSYRRKQK
jgi:hypothetical protein